MVTGRRWRRRLALGLALAVGGGAVWVAPPGVRLAQAEDVIASQPYVEVTGLAELKAQGFNGAGVTIGVIDSPVDVTAPELQGADISVRPPCHGMVFKPGATEHGTAVLSLLANQDWGWAPKAKYIVYPVPSRGGSTPLDATVPQDCVDASQDTLAYAMNLALNDRVDVLNISLDAGGDMDVYATARAALTNVPVVVAAGNGTGLDGHAVGNLTLLAKREGIIAVGANDLNTGVRADYSEYGEGLTVMAPGGPLSIRTADAAGNLTQIHPNAMGTSFAAPMVTGALALAMQKWPEATGNQLIKSLITTAKGSGSWRGQDGYGNFSPRSLIANDPSAYPTDNPLMDKQYDGGREGPGPAPDQVADYRDGLLDPLYLPGDEDYLYCGTDELIIAELPPSRVASGRSPCNAVNGLPPGAGPSATPPGSAAAASSPPAGAAPTGSAGATDSGSSSNLTWIVGAVVVVVLLGGLAAFLVVRSRGRRLPPAVAPLAAPAAPPPAGPAGMPAWPTSSTQPAPPPSAPWPAASVPPPGAPPWTAASVPPPQPAAPPPAPWPAAAASPGAGPVIPPAGQWPGPPAPWPLPVGATPPAPWSEAPPPAPPPVGGQPGQTASPPTGSPIFPQGSEYRPADMPPAPPGWPPGGSPPGGNAS